MVAPRKLLSPSPTIAAQRRNAKSMNVAILAGGLGSRLAEETELKPKPLVEIGGAPILWHIVKHYTSCGFDNFWVAVGYRGEMIKRYFVDYATLTGSVIVRTATGEVERHASDDQDDWTVHVIDTGQDTQTGGRIKRLQPWLGNATFMATYGDGVSDIDVRRLLEFHRAH